MKKYFVKTLQLEDKKKFFLCSKELQVGDLVWDEVYDRKDIVIEHLSLGLVSFRSYSEAMQPHFPITQKEKLTKIIGPISPKAIWIKEDDSFEEEEIEFIILSGEVENLILRNHEELKSLVGRSLTNFHVRLKGPCGHFH